MLCLSSSARMQWLRLPTDITAPCQLFQVWGTYEGGGPGTSVFCILQTALCPHKAVKQVNSNMPRSWPCAHVYCDILSTAFQS